MPPAVQHVTQFNDYRTFLRTVITHEIDNESTPSMAQVAKAFGLSHSALSMVLSGSRDLSLPSIHRIAVSLKMNQTDHEYFEALVLMGQAKDDKERLYYKRKLKERLLPRQAHRVSTPSKTLVSQWFIPALLIYLIDISDNETHFPLLAQKLGIAESELRSVLKALQNEGFLEFKGKGNVHIAFNRLTSIISSKRYIKSVLAANLQRIESHFADEKHWFLTHTFSVSASDIQSFANEYKALVERHFSLGSDDGEKRVYQTSVQIVPVV